MKFLKFVLDHLLEVCASLLALSFAIDSIFLDGGVWSNLLCAVWLLVSCVAGIYRKIK